MQKYTSRPLCHFQTKTKKNLARAPSRIPRSTIFSTQNLKNQNETIPMCTPAKILAKLVAYFESTPLTRPSPTRRNPCPTIHYGTPGLTGIAQDVGYTVYVGTITTAVMIIRTWVPRPGQRSQRQGTQRLRPRPRSRQTRYNFYVKVSGKK